MTREDIRNDIRLKKVKCRNGFKEGMMKRKTEKHIVRQVADAETEDNDAHGADDIHLSLVFHLPMSGATCCLGTTSSRR